MEQELLTIPVFSGVCIALSFLCNKLYTFACSFVFLSFGHWGVCPSLIYGRVGFVQNEHHHHLIGLTCARHDMAEQLLI
jgi:hypothetical protein